MFEASQLKGCTITTFPDQNKILPLLGFLPTAADPPDEVWSQVHTFEGLGDSWSQVQRAHTTPAAAAAPA